MKYKDLTYKIIGCAMEVHKYLGNGFQEVVCQRALAIEMKMQAANDKMRLTDEADTEQLFRLMEI